MPVLAAKLGTVGAGPKGEGGKVKEEGFLFRESFEEFLIAFDRTSFSLEGDEAGRNMLKPLVLLELLSSSGSADDAPESEGEMLCLVTSSVNGFFSEFL